MSEEAVNNILGRNKYYLLLLTFVLLLVCTAVRAEYVADGVTLTQLTNDGRCVALAWAYHGDLIAFIRKVSDAHAIDEEAGPFWSADDRYVAYKVEPGPSETHQVWVADTQSGKNWRILADRGEAKEQRWSPSVPPRICLLVEASGGDDFDAATVDPDGRNLVLLTDIGAQDVEIDEPRWSPTGEWVAFTSGIDMTQTERNLGREDCWIVRPDGSEARNLTNATSEATEEQLDIDEPFWSWDGRWILVEGKRFDNQGNKIATFYIIDPVKGGYEPIMTSYPRETGIYNDFESAKWSYDSTKIAFVTERSTVRNWGPDAESESPQWVLSIYDVRKKRADDILIYDEQIDGKKIRAKLDREEMRDISWSPDGRSILLTIANIVSEEDDIRQPDIYRLDLPERYVDASPGKMESATASQHIGPPMGRESALVEQPSAPVQTPAQAPEGQVPAEKTGFVTEVVRPLHMTVEEAVASLSASYGQYLTSNAARNLLLFKGPPDVLTRFRSDLRLVDTLAPHILVDFLAVELLDEANRDLGLDWTYVEGHFGFFQPAGSAIQKFSHIDTDEDYRAGLPSGALDSLTTLPGVGQSLYQGVGRLPREFFIRLNTLVRDGKGTILANPRTVAMSGKKAMINIRKTLNYFFTEGYDVTGRPIIDKSDISADTIGEIVPTLLADGKIHLVVDVKVGTFTFTKNGGLPELTTRQCKTEINVQQGQTLILGGLRQQEMSTSVTKVPILGDIPLISGLFRREEKDIKHSVLTIFITPQVMTPDNPVPEWLKVNPEDHKLVPIMETLPRNGKAKRPGK